MSYTAVLCEMAQRLERDSQADSIKMYTSCVQKLMFEDNLESYTLFYARYSGVKSY